MTNALMVIHPYHDQGDWVFDDEAVGLKREPKKIYCKAEATKS